MQCTYLGERANTFLEEQGIALSPLEEQALERQERDIFADECLQQSADAWNELKSSVEA